MKLYLFIIINLLFMTEIYGQKTDIYCSLNSGLFSFRGHSTAYNTGIIWYDFNNKGYTSNLYGRKSAICYGVSLNYKRITKDNLILGLDIGFEDLRSKITINQIWGFNGKIKYQYNATGQSYLNNYFINEFPNIGYEINFKSMFIDIYGGCDLGVCFEQIEHGNATAKNGKSYETRKENNGDVPDIRPRIQLSFDYLMIGLYFGYAYGITNYKLISQSDGKKRCYSQLIRFGASYKIK